MTDPFLDELASAHLDGATTPEEAARIAADPSLQARVEALRQVRAALGEVPPADPVAREAGIAAALEAFAEAAPTERSGALPAPPVLAPRRGPSSTALRVLGAAAAIALLALLVPVLGRLADGDDQQASFEQTGSAIGGAPDAAAGGAEDRPRTPSLRPPRRRRDWRRSGPSMTWRRSWPRSTTTARRTLLEATPSDSFAHRRVPGGLSPTDGAAGQRHRPRAPPSGRLERPSRAMPSSSRCAPNRAAPGPCWSSGPTTARSSRERSLEG